MVDSEAELVSTTTHRDILLSKLAKANASITTSRIRAEATEEAAREELEARSTQEREGRERVGELERRLVEQDSLLPLQK